MQSTTAPINPTREPEQDEGANGADQEEALQERMAAFVARLSDEARRRVQRRHNVEQRWIEDLQQYHGIYSPEVQQKLKESESSRIFINATATKTDSMEARLWDLLFPTDDRNWGLEPTPVPELTEEAEGALSRVDKAKEEFAAAEADGLAAMDAENSAGLQEAEQRMAAAKAEESQAQAAADALHETLNEAKRRADLMLAEIDDQLVTCNFGSQARDVIGDACRIGIGVMKGPVLADKGKQRWRKGEAAGENGKASLYVLDTVYEQRPGAHRVDPWAFFPDPDVRRIEDGNGVYERHMMNKDQLRKLARRSDMNREAIRALLTIGPEPGSMPAYMSELYDLTGQTDGDVKDKYQVWEFTGPIETEDMELLQLAFRKDDDPEPEEPDPLIEYNVRIWFCQGKLLSFALHPLDSQEPLYSVFTIRPDEATVFGFGIPYIMRHPQSVLNGAYRMMMDNSGLSTGPQIVINKSMVQPEDGKWKLTARKVWLRDATSAQPGVNPFEAFNIPSNQAELANIIEIASQTIDEVTAQPAIAQGEQGAGVTKTAQGMALLMNSANVSFRRIVKNYDDDITTPLIRRFYHWNMQFSEKEAIKGDYEVQARGSGVLLVREMQAQNLLMIAQMFGDHPTYGPMLKHLDLLKQIFRAHMIAADEITKTEREYKQHLAEQAEAVDPAAAAQMKELELREQELEIRREETDAKVSIAEMERDSRMAVARMTYDSAMEKAAAGLNMKREELDAKLDEAAANNAHRERSLAAEVAMKERTGDSSGGAV